MVHMNPNASPSDDGVSPIEPSQCASAHLASPDGTIDAMSDLGVIVTGIAVGSASGILGAICGAWLTARSQMAGLKLTISADDERTRLAEKRRIYARCLAALNNAWLGRSYLDVPDADVILAYAKEYKVMMGECLNSVFEAALIAPDEIPDIAQDAANGIMNNGKNDRPFPNAIDALIRAMRIDLGEPPLPKKAETTSPDSPAFAAEQGQEP
jgi:hypothetical protein